MSGRSFVSCLRRWCFLCFRWGLKSGRWVLGCACASWGRVCLQIGAGFAEPRLLFGGKLRFGWHKAVDVPASIAAVTQQQSTFVCTASTRRAHQCFVGCVGKQGGQGTIWHVLLPYFGDAHAAGRTRVLHFHPRLDARHVESMSTAG